MPSQISMWTDELLVKHGGLVKEMRLELSVDWTMSDDEENRHIIERDNLLVGQTVSLDATISGRAGLSYLNTVKVLVSCSNLKKIHVRLPDHEQSDMHAPNFHLLLTRLGGLLSRFNGLRMISLQEYPHHWIPDRYIALIVKDLPLLESLWFKKLSQSEADPSVHSLQWHLAQLSHLSELSVENYAGVDSSWCLESWPKTLTKLTLMRCNRLSLPALHQLIVCMAPRLEELNLLIGPVDPAGMQQCCEEYGTDWPEKIKFNLPALTSLVLSGALELPLLENFRDCLNLSRIDYRYIQAEEWHLTEAITSGLIWPKLTSLKLESIQPTETDWDSCLMMFKVRRYCVEAGIEFSYTPF